MWETAAERVAELSVRLIEYALVPMSNGKPELTSLSNQPFIDAA